MRQRQKNRGWWTLVVALGAVAVACSAVDENDKTQNPRLDAGSGAAPGDDAGVPTATGGTGATTGDAGP